MTSTDGYCCVWWNDTFIVVRDTLCYWEMLSWFVGSHFQCRPRKESSFTITLFELEIWIYFVLSTWCLWLHLLRRTLYIYPRTHFFSVCLLQWRLNCTTNKPQDCLKKVQKFCLGSLYLDASKKWIITGRWAECRAVLHSRERDYWIIRQNLSAACGLVKYRGWWKEWSVLSSHQEN